MPIASIVPETLALIFTSCTLPHGIKRRSSDDWIDDRPRKLAKFGSHRLSPMSMDGIAFQIKYRANFISDLQHQVHKFLMEHRTIPMDEMVKIIQQFRGTVRVSSISPTVITEEKPQVRRSNRNPNLIHYADVSHDETTTDSNSEWAEDEAMQNVQPKPTTFDEALKWYRKNVSKLSEDTPSKETAQVVSDTAERSHDIVAKRAQYEAALTMLQLSYTKNVTKPEESALRHSLDLIADMAVYKAAVAILQLSLSESAAKPVESAPSHSLGLDMNEEAYEAALAMVQLSHSGRVTIPEESALRPSLDLVVNKKEYEAAIAMLQLSRSENVVKPAESALGYSLGWVMNEKSASTSNDPMQNVTPEQIKTASAKKREKGGKLRKTRNLDTEEFFMPSAKNDWKFKYDSTSGLTCTQLNALLKPPARTPMSKSDADGLYTNGLGALSYQHLGTRPKKGLADKLVTEMETRNTKEQFDVDHRL